MIVFAKTQSNQYYAIETSKAIDAATIPKLEWLLAGEILSENELEGFFIGPRKEMLTPWCTNSVEITQNMGIEGIIRVEQYSKEESTDAEHDPMLEVVYKMLYINNI